MKELVAGKPVLPLPVGKAEDIQQCKSSWFESLVKGELKRTIIPLLHKYPKPTRDNCKKRNSLVWLELKEDYLAHELNPTIASMATVFFNLIIDSHEHDPPYEERIDTLAEKIADAYNAGKFKRRDHPMSTQWK